MIQLLRNIRYLYYKKLTDEKVIQKRFRKYVGREVELQNPIEFNDKLQWLKLNWYDPKATLCADKFEARTIVANKIGERYLNELYAVYESVKEIDIAQLPNSFVLKATHGTGDNLICHDKGNVYWKTAYKRMEKWFKKNIYWTTREWVYRDIKPKIICERLLAENEISNTLTDYKIYCFNGTPRFCQVIKDRGYEGVGTIDFFDTEWNHMEFTGLQKAPHSFKKIPKPDRYEEMLELATILSKDFPFVRVDFYYVNGNIYFGELTFFPKSGFGEFDPPEWNERIGNLLELPQPESQM